jgi:hypothetical protein
MDIFAESEGGYDKSPQLLSRAEGLLAIWRKWKSKANR